eukprot:scpid40967/ scgid8819/ Intraflagellar transport protein 57 homolog
MAEAGGDSGRRGGGGGGGDAPVAGSLFIPVMMMEDLLDKLKLLNYEHEFCAQNEIRPFPRHHFALAGDTSQQFFHFASLVSWLLSLQGKKMEKMQEYDDPNAVVSTVITNLKAAGVPANFPPSRLKQGHGESVLQVLDALAETALRTSNWVWRAPRHDDAAMGDADVDEVEDELEDETAEVKTGKGSDFDEIADETAMIEGSDDDDDDAVGMSGIKESLLRDAAITRPKEALVSHADATEWKLEVERVLPSLKIHIRADEKDWRVHTQRIDKHTHEINEQLADTRQQLSKLHDDISKALEKMGSREKYVNTQLSSQLAEFRKLNDTSTETGSRYSGSSTGVTDLTRELATLTDELDSLKSQMDEYGQSLSDAAPLVQLKQTLTRLKADVVDADMRAGVLEHILTTTGMKKKNQLQRDLNIERPTIMSSNYGEFNTV